VKKLAILAVAAGFVAGAQAQTIETSISVRGGIQFPTTADLDGTFWGVGADINLAGGFNFIRGGSPYVSVDWISKNLSFNRNFIIPICLNMRFPLNTTADTVAGPSTYAFFGLGAAIIDIGNAATVLCGRAGLGADFTSNVYGELSLVLTSRGKGNGVQGNHVGAWIGYRF
jgi:hypothetical protein